MNSGVTSTTPKLVLKPVPDMPAFAQAMPSAETPFRSPPSSPNCKSALPQKAGTHLPDPLPASGRVEGGLCSAAPEPPVSSREHWCQDIGTGHPSPRELVSPAPRAGCEKGVAVATDRLLQGQQQMTWLCW